MRRPLAALAVLLLPLAAPAQPYVYSVINGNDSGPGSLRQAITDANTLAVSGQTITINFNTGLNVTPSNFLSPLNAGRAGQLGANDNTLVINGNGSTLTGSLDPTT